MLLLLELEVFRFEAYESVEIYKFKVKQQHDARSHNRELKVGEKVLLFDYKLKLFPKNLNLDGRIYYGRSRTYYGNYN